MSAMNNDVLIAGTGALGSALAKGIACYDKNQARLHLFDVDGAKARAVAEQCGAQVASRVDLNTPFGVVVIAVKPADVANALAMLGPAIGNDTLVISCAAGVSIAAITVALRGRGKVVRAMPNVAAKVMASCTVLVPSADIDSDEMATVSELFLAVGTVHRMQDEHSLHAVTALAASGPAFAALVIESFIDAGVRSGLSRALSEQLTAEMMRGTIALIDSGVSPTELRSMVTSPAGTTAEGLAVLERCAVRSAMNDAILAASARAKELGS